MTGYTDKQAERQHHRIDLAVAKIEDDLVALARVEPDTSIGSSGAGYTGTAIIGDQIREVGDYLHATVDRRRRP